MKIASVKIGAHRYGVECDDPRLGDDGNWAEHDSRNRVLRIDTVGRPPNAVAEDLVHEILHGLFLDAGRGDFDGDEEERAVTMLAPRLTAFLADNPDVVRELLRMLK